MSASNKPLDADREAMAPVLNLQKSLQHLESKVMPFADLSKAEVESQLLKSEAANLNIAMAYGITSLYYVFLKSRGVDVMDHGVQNELDRIKVRMGKLIAVKKMQQRSTVINVEASKRVISHGLEGNHNYDAERLDRETAAASKGLQKMSVDSDGAPQSVKRIEISGDSLEKFIKPKGKKHKKR